MDTPSLVDVDKQPKGSKPKRKQEQIDRSSVSSDDLTEPIKRLKRLQGAVTLLASLGSQEHECTDPGVILRFCELVEDNLRSSLEELDALQLALAN
jgi:hypothetical protein